MNISLAYGRGRLAVNVPEERTTVIEPSYIEGLPDEATTIRHALRQPIGAQPLRTLVSTEHTVAISVCDITRPMPSSTLLPVLLEELSHVPTTQIKILIAAGTHRECTHDELVEMFGESIVDNCQIINHNAFDESSLVHLGEVKPDVPVWLNRHWVDADIRLSLIHI